MAAAAVSGGNEVEDTIRDLKKIPGFSSYCILNNDGNIYTFKHPTTNSIY